MAQIVKENGLLKIVDKDAYLFGEAKGTDVIHFEFDYKGSESSIEYLETTCSCIKVWYKDGKIKGTLDLAKVQKGPYLPGQTSVAKAFNVIINDGVARFIGNELKQKQPHAYKKWFQLTVTGLVVA